MSVVNLEVFFKLLPYRKQINYPIKAIKDYICYIIIFRYNHKNDFVSI